MMAATLCRTGARTLLHAILALSLLGALLAAASAGASTEDSEVDYLELATVLVRDGNYDRGEQALANVDLASEELDLVRYHTLYGLIFLNRNELAEATAAFYRAIDAGQTEPVVYIYLAQAHFGLEEYRDAIKSLDAAGETALRLPSAHLMKAHSHWLLGEHADTWRTLTQAQRRFPANHIFLRREVFYLIELGYYQAASERGREYLSLTAGNEDDYVNIGNALRESRQFNEALRFLEAARLKFPASARVAKVLAQTYLDMDQVLTAADLLYDAALLEPALVGEAAEVYRRAGKLHRALLLNGQIQDQPTKLKQRLAILLEQEEFDKVEAMVPAMKRARLLDNEDVVYAVAYAYFKLGEYAAAKSYLARLTRADLFNKSIELRKAMEECIEEAWKCV